MTERAQVSAAVVPLVRLKSRARKVEPQFWLEIGQTIRYQGLGSGKVIDHVTREFQGKMTTFAVISFPHRDMIAQIPLGDSGFAAKIRPVSSATSLERSLKLIATAGQPLQRTWDERETVGNRILHKGSPGDWAALLRDYASGVANGLLLTASDSDLIRSAQEMFAAEYSCATDIPYEEALEKVRSVYQRSIQRFARTRT